MSHDDEVRRKYRYRGERMILIGANPVASLFIRLLNAYAPHQRHVIAVLDPDSKMIGRAISGVQVVGNPQDLEAIVKEYAVHGVVTGRVVVAGEVDFLSPVVLREVEHVCHRHQISLSFLPRMIGLTVQDRVEVAVSTEHEFAKPSIALPSFLKVKRLIDIIGSLALLFVLSPLFSLVARTGFFGCRVTCALLARARRLEGSQFLDLQISNAGIAI